MAKRKKDEEYRTFQQEWTEEFAFVERAGSAVCLIYKDKIALMKWSNIKQHFDTRQTTFPSKYPAGDSRKKAYQKLVTNASKRDPIASKRFIYKLLSTINRADDIQHSQESSV